MARPSPFDDASREWEPFSRRRHDPFEGVPATSGGITSGKASRDLGLGVFYRLLGLGLVVGFFVLLRYNVGPVVEEMRYAWVRAQLRAEAEDARGQLASPARLDPSDTAARFPLVAQSVAPCVVHIETLRLAQGAHGPERIGPTLPRRLKATGQGAGVVVESDGFVLTNFHVIRGASSVRVRMSDGRTFDDVEIIGVDPPSDLAVLKVEAENLVAAPWGDSGQLKIGQWVMAVGNPFGLDRTVTAGIVSAKRRHNVVRNMPYQDFLQTDAAVNPGNSGGPLVNLQGEVVGITTAIVGESYQGVGFAIPSEIARDVYGRLKASGEYTRGWLGVAMQDITPEMADELDVPRQGVRVASVVGAPAQRAGLQDGDIILSFNGQEIRDKSQFSLLVARTRSDSTANIVLRRDGKKLTVQVKLGRRRFATPS